MRQFLAKCDKCGCLSRGTIRGLKAHCMCYKTKQDSEYFKTHIAPVVAEQTNTVYGGMGRFWKVFDNGDVRVLFVRRESA